MAAKSGSEAAPNSDKVHVHSWPSQDSSHVPKGLSSKPTTKVCKGPSEDSRICPAQHLFCRPGREPSCSFSF